MRICLYTETALPMLGGQELVVDALARQFRRLGHAAVVLAPQPRSSAAGPAVAPPYPVVRHPRFLSTHRGIAWYRRYLLRLYRRAPFDILHCHSVYPAGYLGVLSAKAIPVPVVITSHGGDLAPDSSLLRKPNVRDRCLLTLARADALVAIGRFTRDAYATLLPDAPIVDIPNGVDAAAFADPAPSSPPIPAGLSPRSYWLFLGRLSARKGVDVLLDAMAAIPVDRRRRLVVAGAGERRAELEAQARSAGLGGSVDFLGPVGGSAKVWLLQNALAVVMPSRGWEAFPLVVLESFAAGSPVVAAATPGLRDLVAPGRTGWLFEPERPDALAEILRAMDEAEASRRGAEARAEAERHDWSRIAGQHLRLYQDLLGRRRGSGAADDQALEPRPA